MLVLSRKLGEKIVIGDKIVVTVVKIDRNQVRLGIEAPQEVSVFREEITPQAVRPPAERGEPAKKQPGHRTSATRSSERPNDRKAPAGKR